MNDREKLIELLEGAESAVYWNSSDKTFIEKIADYLIANGAVLQKQGKWEYHDCVCTGEGLAAVYACSACHACIDEEVFERLNATGRCPNCGAKMGDEHEE